MICCVCRIASSRSPPPRYHSCLNHIKGCWFPLLILCTRQVSSASQPGFRLKLRFCSLRFHSALHRCSHGPQQDSQFFGCRHSTTRLVHSHHDRNSVSGGLDSALNWDQIFTPQVFNHHGGHLSHLRSLAVFGATLRRPAPCHGLRQHLSGLSHHHCTGGENLCMGHLGLPNHRASGGGPRCFRVLLHYQASLRSSLVPAVLARAEAGCLGQAFLGEEDP